MLHDVLPIAVLPMSLSWKNLKRRTGRSEEVYVCPYRTVAASAATLAPPQIIPQPAVKPPPTMAPVTETQEGLSAAGFTFLRNVGRSFFVNTEAAPSVGMVLGLKAADGRPTALEEATLGQLCCNRSVNPAHQ